MNRALMILKKVWFGINNFIFFPNKTEFNILFWLNFQNKSKVRQWFLYSLVMNLVPFIISVFIQFFVNDQNVMKTLNNGSLPIIAFSIIATNFVYLSENIQTEREIYAQLKGRVIAISVLLVLAASILYILQSNFLDFFNESRFQYSLLVSILLLYVSVVIGKKMFLLQNRLITNFEEQFQQQLNNLNQIPDNNDIRF